MTRNYSLFQNEVSPIHAEPGHRPFCELWAGKQRGLGEQSYIMITQLSANAGGSLIEGNRRQCRFRIAIVSVRKEGVVTCSDLPN
jgi:hypothetical protein